MRLDQLLGGLAIRAVRGHPENDDVTGVTHDSRATAPGSLFCCVRGARADGHDHAPAAVAAGAVALLCERFLDLPVTQVQVPDVRRAMGPVAAAFYGHPSRRLTVVGITGTNGKTTTAHLVRAVLDAAGRPCEVIGTLTGSRTTPEATELQSRLAALEAEGVASVAVEVSSHALEQHRVDGTWFSVAVFTNLGRDHLDFHGTEEAYFRAKARLFDPERAAVAVVNADDPHGRLLLDAAHLPTRAFSMDDAEELDVGVEGTTFRWRGAPVRLRLGGRFNVANALAAAAACEALGVMPDVVAHGLTVAPPVPGRFERVTSDAPFSVVVDYAHTPDGLEQLLHAARAVSAGRVIVVFGCGGERDRGKRPAMGDVATRLADRAVLTNDNPRHEDPMAIIDEVRAGASRAEVLTIEPDRRAAIASALAGAREGDVVVVAGKGHEAGQTIGDVIHPFDDRAVAREELMALGYRP